MSKTVMVCPYKYCFALNTNLSLKSVKIWLWRGSEARHFFARAGFYFWHETKILYM